MLRSTPWQGFALCLMLAALTATSVPGASAADPDYQVDVVVFTFNNPHEDERLVSTSRSPDLLEALRLEDRDLPEGFEAVPSSDTELADVVATIKRSSRYRLLGHFSWRQPGLERALARPVRVHGGKDFTDELRREYISLPPEHPLSGARIPGDTQIEQFDGTVKLGKGRYLHLETDLVYRQPETVSILDAVSGTEVRRNELQQYPVQDHRRMRSGELHYVDHPLLGLLVTVTRLEGASATPEPEPEPDAGSGEAASAGG